MILPKVLIYKQRFSLEEFYLDEEGYNKDLFEALLQCKDVVWESYGDLEGQYLSIFNAAYYLCSDIMRSKYPYLKIKEYCDYVRSEVRGDSNKMDAVFCVILALLHDYYTPSMKIIKLREAICKRVDKNFYNKFVSLLPADFKERYEQIWCGPWLALLPLTEDYLKCHANKMAWKEWTNDFSEEGLRILLMNAGVLKEEKLNILDAIAMDMVNEGREDVNEVLSQFYDEVGRLRDSIDGHQYRSVERTNMVSELRKVQCCKNPLKEECYKLKKESELKDKRINECERKIDALNNRLNELIKENIQMMDECTTLKADCICKEARILELETDNTKLLLKLDESNESKNLIININNSNVGTETKNIEQAIGIAESGSQIIHTNYK